MVVFPVSSLRNLSGAWLDITFYNMQNCMKDRPVLFQIISVPNFIYNFSAVLFWHVWVKNIHVNFRICNSKMCLVPNLICLLKPLNSYFLLQLFQSYSLGSVYFSYNYVEVTSKLSHTMFSFLVMRYIRFFYQYFFKLIVTNKIIIIIVKFQEL